MSRLGEVATHATMATSQKPSQTTQQQSSLEENTDSLHQSMSSRPTNRDHLDEDHNRSQNSSADRDLTSSVSKKLTAAKGMRQQMLQHQRQQASSNQVPNTPIFFHVEEPALTAAEIITPILHTRPINPQPAQLLPKEEEFGNNIQTHLFAPLNTHLAVEPSLNVSSTPIGAKPRAFHHSPSASISFNPADHPTLIPPALLQSESPMSAMGESGSINASMNGLNNNDLQLEPALGLLDPITMSPNPVTGSLRKLGIRPGDDCMKSIHTLSNVIQMSPLHSISVTGKPVTQDGGCSSSVVTIAPVIPSSTFQPVLFSSPNLKKQDSQGDGGLNPSPDMYGGVGGTMPKSGELGGKPIATSASPVNEFFSPHGQNMDMGSTDEDQVSRSSSVGTSENWLGKKCGLLFPASCGGYNFVKVFVIMTACQVIVTCALVWLVGYIGLLAATNSLSHEIRISVMSNVVDGINDRFLHAVYAANQIHYLTRLRFDDIDTTTSVTDDPGYLADLYHVGLLYPTLARIGYVNANGVYVSIQRAKNATEFSSNQLLTVTINDPDTQQLNTYRPTPIPARNVISNSAPLFLRPEMRDDDSAAFIASYLGPPIWSLTNFSVFQLTYMPAILKSVEESTLRQQDSTITDLGAGWTAPFPALSRGSGETKGYFALSNFKPSVDPVSGNFTMAGFALYRLGDLEDSFKDQHFGAHGIIHVIRAGGGIIASSDQEIHQQLEVTQADIDLDNNPDELMQKMTELLREWGLVVPDSVNDTMRPQNVSYTTEQFSANLHANGYSWRINAQMLGEHSAALPYTVVLLTRDDDFDGNFQTILRDSSVVAAAICLAAMILTFAIARCLTRPLIQVVDYMSRAVRVISMERGPSQREALTVLCEEWSKDSGMKMPNLVSEEDPLATRSTQFNKMQTYSPNTPSYANFCWFCNNSGDTCCCYRVGRSLREVQAMHAAFGSMIYTLASYDELEAINQAKRQFIRYIFHEVRVPFNAIVLGIEQMQLELTPLGSMCASTIETLNILREQSSVVSRILNDVLSMQKIEDGALALEYDSFSLERMIRAALYAFRTPCLEKRLKVRVNLRNLDAIVNEALPGLQLGKCQKRVSTTSTHSGVLNQPQSNNVNQVPSTDQNASNQPIPAVHSPPHALPMYPSSSTFSGGRASSEVVESVQLSANVFGDHYRLRQCLANFVSNAVKFNGIGGVIRVSLELTNFEPNPLATIASDHILREMGIEPKRTSKNHSTSRGRKTPPQTSLNEQILTMEGGGGLNRFDGGHDHNVHPHLRTSPQGSPRNRPSEPLIPELLGTVRVRVAVKDNGSGIPLDHQAHIFEAYHQVQAGKIQSGNGTGLGLNISKSIIELHGGSIGYTSTPGAGAEFYFTLPMDVMLVKSVGRNNHDSISFQTSHNSGANSSQLKPLHPHSTPLLDHSSPTPTISSSSDQSLQNNEDALRLALTNGTDLGNERAHSDLLPTTTSAPAPLSIDRMKTDQMISSSQMAIPISDPITILKRSPQLKPQHPLPDSLPSDSRQISSTTVTGVEVTLHHTTVSSREGVTGDTFTSNNSVTPIPPAERSRSEPNYIPQPIIKAPPIMIDLVPVPIAAIVPAASSNFVASNENSSRPSSRITAHRPSISSSGGSGGGEVVRRNSHANLGVSIPSSHANASHSRAQNLIHCVISKTSTMTATTTTTITQGTATSIHSPSVTPPYGSLQQQQQFPTVIASSTSSTTAASTTISSPIMKKSIGSPSPSSNSLQGCRVLVVEDSHPNRKLLISLLTHMGCKSAGAENGLECVNLFKDSFGGGGATPTLSTPSVTPNISPQSPLGWGPSDTIPMVTASSSGPSSPSAVPFNSSTANLPFDIILMDGSMPVMNGIEATQILRSHGLKIPIIAVTGNALDEDVKAFMLAGAEAVLTKPVNRQKLEQLLRTYFHQQK